MSQQDCLFCRIVRREIPSQIVHETDELLAFRDIDPKAPLHVLIVPKRHISTVNDVEPSDAALLGQLFVAARTIAAEQGVAEDGYRLVVNTNAGAGQTVFHIHMHLLGGRGLSWPPG
ncbi:MAG: histidine triad nucleotide-binding protein [Candidatus Cloacimonetes bacterium]|jgi:histidine triad (HIT) family protein|nr:histidine triad nucleotide-binding protein [Candidatus Cloacimonadota bacterium]